MPLAKVRGTSQTNSNLGEHYSKWTGGTYVIELVLDNIEDGECEYAFTYINGLWFCEHMLRMYTLAPRETFELYIGPKRFNTIALLSKTQHARHLYGQLPLVMPWPSVRKIPYRTVTETTVQQAMKQKGESD